METKYTKADIISWQNLPEDFEKLIGKEVYFEDIYKVVVTRANNDSTKGKVDKVDKDSEIPFHINNHWWKYIIPVKEPTYAELQEEWIRENNIMLDIKVRIVKPTIDLDIAEPIKKALSQAVGKIGTIDHWTSTGIYLYDIEELRGYYIPFYALEPVKEEFKVGDIVIYTSQKDKRQVGIIQSINNDSWVQFNSGSSWCKVDRMKLATKDDFVPYDLSKKEVRDKLRDKWIKCTSGIYPDEYKITGFRRFDVFCIHLYENIHLDSESLLNKWTFLDGLPCGELKNEDI